ncbi:MAG: DUF11 domain-containing protein [Nitratireductor sp.]|nr:DUF11 domain-containing protein [Nitratireductor sp.]
MGRLLENCFVARLAVFFAALLTTVAGSGQSARAQVSPPTFTQAFSTDRLEVGDTATLTLSILNLAAGAKSGLQFSDTLPTGLTFAASPNLTTNCLSASTSINTGAGTFSLDTGTVGGFSGCTVTVQITAVTPGIYTNTTSDLTSNAGNHGPAIASPAGADTVTVIERPGFSKSFTPNTINSGETSLVTVTIDNTANVLPATNLNFSDVLPVGVSIVTPDDLATDCTSAATSIDTGTGTFSLDSGEVAAGASCSVTLTVTSSTGGTHTNTISDFTSSLGGVEAVGATLTVNSTPTAGAPAFSKAFTPGSIEEGGISTLTFTVDNSANASPASALSFFDPLPTGLTVASVANAASSCGGTVTAASIGSSINFAGGSVAANGVCTVSVDVTSNTAGSYVNTTNDLNSSLGNSGTASDTLTVTSPLPPGSEPPALVKSFTPSTITTGSNSLLTLTINHLRSAVPATNLNVSDTLPAGVVFAATPNLSSTCTGASTSIGGSTFSLDDGEVAAGGSCTVTVEVTSSTSGIYTNTTGNLTSNLGNSGSASAKLTVSTAPAAGTPLFSKSFSPDTIDEGGTSTLTFTIDNSANATTATSLAFLDTLPANLVLGTPDNESSTCGGILTVADGGSSIELASGGVLAGSVCTIAVDVTSNIAGTYVNTSGNLTSTSGDSGNAIATLSVNAVTPPATTPPILSKSFAPSSITSGATSVLTLSIDNTRNSVAATNLAVSDTLPAGVVFAAAPNLASTCTSAATSLGGSTFSLDDGEIAGGSSCTVTVNVTSTTNGTYNNTTSDLVSSLGNSGTASASLTVTTAPDAGAPGFSKVFVPSTIAAGGVSTLTFTIDNTANVVAASALDFTDNLPAGVVVATPANAGTTCTGGTLTAAAGASVASYSGGTVAAGAACTISVDVTSNAIGSHVNTTGDLTSSLGNSGSATDTLTVSGAAPLFTKAFAPDQIPSGGTSTLTFTIDNSANSAAADQLDFSDNLPAGLVIATPANLGTNCSGGILTGSAGSGLISYRLGSVAANASCTVTANVTATLAGSYVNTTGALTSTFGNSGTATDTLVVANPPLFSKVFAPDSIGGDGISTLTFTIDNTANVVAASALDFTDNLPAGVTVATPANASTTCTGGTLTAAAGSSVASYSGGTVAAGATCSIAVDVTSNTTGSHVNTTGSLTSSLGNSGTASDTLTVDADAPSVSINGAPAVVNSTAPFTVSIVFSEEVTGFVLGDVSVGSGAASNLSTVDNITFTVDITPSGAGDITIDVAAGVANDLAGNPNTAAPQVVVGYDVTAPTVAILNAPEFYASDLSPFTVTVQFSEDVTGFVAGDVTVGNGTVSSFTPVSGSEYTVEITPDGSGDVTIDIAADVAFDSGGNGNTAATQVVVRSQIVDETQRIIAQFMLNRANFLLGNQPDIISMLEGNHGSGGGPLGHLSVDGNEDGMDVAFATSLSKVDEAKANELRKRLAERSLDDRGPGYSGLPGTSQAAVESRKIRMVGDTADGGAPAMLETRRLTAASAADKAPATAPKNDAEAGATLAERMAPEASESGVYAADAGNLGAYAAMPQRRYDIWTEIHGARASAGDTDSSYWVGYLGGHYFVSPDFLIGALVQFDWADEDNDAANSSVSGHGWMAGPYLAGRIAGTTLAYEARAAWGRSDNDITPFGTYTDHFETERFLVSGKVQGSLQFDSVTVTPAVRVSWFKETQESYVDSLSNTIPEQTISLGEVRFGPTFSRTIALADGTMVTPSIGISGVWNFDIDTAAATQSSVAGTNDLRARADFGLSMVNSLGWTLNASGYYDGIGVDGYEAVGGKLKLVIPIQ